MTSATRTSAFLSSNRPPWLALGIIGFLLFLPTQIGEFWVHVASEIAMMSLFALSFNLLFGYMGHLSFGQAAYLGAAGYTMGVLVKYAHLNFYLAMILGVVGGTAWALATGYLCIRSTGIYFSLMTIVISQVTFWIGWSWYSVLGGPMGFSIEPPPFLRNPLNFYIVTLAIVIPMIAALWLVVRSPFGRSLQCIRDNPDKTPFLGIPMKKHMLIAFVIAGFYSAVAGVLWTVFNRGISPHYAGMMKSADSVFMAVLGGIHTFAGPILGSVIWTLLNVFVIDLTKYWPLTIGGVMLFIIFAMREGILGTLAEKLYEKTWQRRRVVGPTEEARL